MLTMITIAATVTAAATSIIYIRHASIVNRDQHIPFVFHRLANVPLWFDVLSYPGWCVSAILLGLTLPLWLGMGIYCVAALLPWELMRRRHNNRVARLDPSVGPSSIL
ncbi:hypothetical protein ACWGE1_13945 [Streptomyces sp. NPDC054932]